MGRLVFILSIFTLATFALTTFSFAEIDISGFIENQERVRIAKDEDALEKDQYPFDIMMADTLLDINLRGMGLDGKARMFVDLDMRHMGLLGDENVELRLREGWAGYYMEHFSFSIGKRIYMWGMADEMNPTDLLNAEDLRWFFTYDKPARKIGDFSANMAVKIGNFKLEGVWIPLFTPTKFADIDSDWLPWKLDLFYSFVDQFPEFVDFQSRSLPKSSIGNSSAAGRFSGIVGPVDFELTAYDGWDHMPTFDVLIDTDPELIISGGKPLSVVEEYQRFNAFGGSVSGVIGPTTFRTEGAFYTDRYFMHKLDDALLVSQNILTAYNLLIQMKDDKFRTKKQSFNVVGGLDYRYGNLLYINAQYFHLQILDYEDFLLDDEIDNGFSGKMELSFLDQTLKVATNGAVNISQEDWYLNPYISYLITDSLKIEGGTILFGGEYETNFGEFDRNDYAYTKLRFSF